MKTTPLPAEVDAPRAWVWGAFVLLISVAVLSGLTLVLTWRIGEQTEALEQLRARAASCPVPATRSSPRSSSPSWRHAATPEATPSGSERRALFKALASVIEPVAEDAPAKTQAQAAYVKRFDEALQLHGARRTRARRKRPARATSLAPAAATPSARPTRTPRTARPSATPPAAATPSATSTRTRPSAPTTAAPPAATAPARPARSRTARATASRATTVIHVSVATWSVGQASR